MPASGQNLRCWRNRPLLWPAWDPHQCVGPDRDPTRTIGKAGYYALLLKTPPTPAVKMGSPRPKQPRENTFLIDARGF